MSSIDVIPKKDTDFETFQSVFYAAVNTNQVAWGLPAADITSMGIQQGFWAAAWLIAKDKQNCTSAQRKAKDLARADYEALIRPFIQKWIYRNPLMDDAEVEQCGLRPRDRIRTKVPVPDAIPLVEVLPGSSNTFKVIFRQQLNEPGSTKRGKPKGVAYCEFVYVIGSLPNSPDNCNKYHLATRSPLKVQITPGQGGQTVWFYARWVNTTGEGGPWTTLDSFLIPY